MYLDCVEQIIGLATMLWNDNSNFYRLSREQEQFWLFHSPLGQP